MPGETTYYRRLQVLLELSASIKPKAAESFVDNIKKKSPPNYVYHRWDPEKEELVARCSKAAIEKTLSLGVELGLLREKTGMLTKAGEEAADLSRFDIVLRRQLRLCFERLGCSAALLEETCGRFLRRRNITLPTADELYNELFLEKGLDTPAYKFRRFIRLLAYCGGIRNSRRQIFLPSG
jgi:hypothetical protein